MRADLQSNMVLRSRCLHHMHFIICVQQLLCAGSDLVPESPVSRWSTLAHICTASCSVISFGRKTVLTLRHDIDQSVVGKDGWEISFQSMYLIWTKILMQKHELCLEMFQAAPKWKRIPCVHGQLLPFAWNRSYIASDLFICMQSTLCAQGHADLPYNQMLRVLWELWGTGGGRVCYVMTTRKCILCPAQLPLEGGVWGKCSKPYSQW